MLLRNIKLMVVMSLLFVCAQWTWSQAAAGRMIHGEVLQVYPQQAKILLANNGEKKIFLLEENCQILRQGSPASLNSMRPIAPDAFQDVLCWFNARGLISHIFVNYSVQEEDGILVSYDIFGNKK